MGVRRRMVFHLLLAFGLVLVTFYVGVALMEGKGDTPSQFEQQDLLISQDSNEAFVTKALRRVDYGRVGECQPRHNIMYLKIHKSGSSTLQNILYRYVKSHNKDLYGSASASQAIEVAHSGNMSTGEPARAGAQNLPIIVGVPSYSVYFGHPKKFNVAMLEQPWNLPLPNRVNILADHTRLDVEQMKQVLHSDTLWVTVIRHPVQLFRSLFAYYKLENFVKAPLETFLKRQLVDMKRVKRLNGSFGANQMTFDLGYDPDTLYDDAKIDLMIQEIEDAFHLVLVAERMDESLVLLGHSLCWSIQDMIALRKNARFDQDHDLTEEGIKTIEELNYVDMRLYQHFSHKFDLLAEAYGRTRLQEEVLALRRERQRLEEYCVLGTVKGHDPRATVRERSQDVFAYRLKHPENATCLNLCWTTIRFLDHFRASQKRLFQTTSQ